MIFKFFLCSAAVAAAGALLPFSVYAAELEDFEDESVVGEVFDSDYSDEIFLSPSPDGFFYDDDSGVSDFGSDFIPDSSPEPVDDDFVFDSDLPSDSVYWDGYIYDDSLLEEEDYFEPSPSPDFLVDDDNGVIPYASYDTYYGSIGTTYLEYMRGFLPKLGFRDHYVGARVSQYTYIFAYGENLSWTGSLFTGRDVMVITWNTQNNGSFSYGYQSAFNINPGSFLVYSDLTDFYPSLADSSAFSLRQILILFTIFCLSLTMIHMYNVRKVRR